MGLKSSSVLVLLVWWTRRMIVQSLEEEKGRKSVSREVDVEVDGWDDATAF